MRQKSLYGVRMVRHGAGAGGDSFRAVIRAARKRRGLTQAELAHISGVSRSTLIRWESGEIARPEPDQLNAVIEAVGVPAEDVYRALGWPLSGPDGTDAPAERTPDSVRESPEVALHWIRQKRIEIIENPHWSAEEKERLLAIAYETEQKVRKAEADLATELDAASRNSLPGED